MTAWKRVAMGLGVLVGVGVVGLLGAVGWAGSARDARMAQRFEAHTVDFPVPFPLGDAEIAALRAERTPPPPTDVVADAPTVEDPPVDVLADVDLSQIALERARERGRHLVESRYACIECHGADFAGGTMIDAAPMGKILGRNLTRGAGGVVASYTRADWDRLVRHGIKPDGTPAIMPSEDFLAMSDRELSDIIAYIESMPPVDRDVPPPSYGPIGTMLVATGEMRLSAEALGDHHAAHAVEAPDPTDTLAFGRHLGQVCTGCHRADLSGGPIIGGDPSWLPASNLTPTGLSGYTDAAFVEAMRTGRRPDGRPFGAPMAMIVRYSARMSDAELQALWAWLQTVPPADTAK